MKVVQIDMKGGWLYSTPRPTNARRFPLANTLDGSGEASG